MVPLSDEVRMIPLEPTTTCDGLEVVLVVVVLSVVVEEPLSLLLLQDMEMKLKRNIEMMMSICLTWFPNCLVLGEPNIYQNLV